MPFRVKTNGGMLPQFRPLEARVADNLQGCGRNGSGHTAAVQQSRGESSTDARVEPSPAVCPMGASAVNGVSRIFVIDKKGEPLMPCHPARARKLLAKGRARVHKMFPFTIRLVDRTRENSDVQPVNVKIDPGAKTTGMAVVRQDGGHVHILNLSELTHRGSVIRKKLGQRSNYRRRRRTANLWYRKPRFNNRTRLKGWLPPSLRSRVDNTLSWVKKYQKICPVTGIVIERVRFDTQKLQNPDISGIGYQQGTLFGYEVKEYLLERYGRKCVYCNGLSNDPVLEIEHFVPRNPSKGDKGSNRISNLAIACKTCNQDSKKNLQPADWISLLSRSRKKIDQVRLQNATRFLEGKRPSLASTAAVNATRNAIFFELRGLGLPVECSTGGRTKYNRSRLNIPKTHCLDAACTGQVDTVSGWKQNVFLIKAMGRGSYQRTRVDKYGFPRGTLMAQKTVKGFATGDMVKAIVPAGKKQGTYFGRVAVRKSGSFNIQSGGITIQGISWRYCKSISRQNGYGFTIRNSSLT
jgi:5-methylcytosine-specific restriction endonuclease McrA